MHTKSSLFPCIVLAMAAGAFADTIVNDFKVNGWASWDTRDASGTNLRGTNDTHSAIGGTFTAGDDTKIENQIKFLSEGSTVNDAAGAMPDPNPTGSYLGKGYVRLDGTNSNSGKSDLSYVNTGGLGSGTNLLGSSFSTSYRYYTDSNTTSRTIGLNISLSDGTAANTLTLNHVQDPYTANDWNTETLTDSSLFFLYGSAGGNAAPGGGGGTKSLSAWLADATFGSYLQSLQVFRVGFNIGSSQRNGLIYLDWLDTSLLNGGVRTDFQGPAPVVPAPGAALLVTLGVGSIAGFRRKFSGSAPA